MNKRITSLLLSLVMVFSMLATAVPALAVDTTYIKITPDKTEAHPGDTITYTVIMTAVDECGAIGLKIQLPDDLTYVDYSGTVLADKTVLSADDESEFKTLTNNRVMFSNLDCNYVSASDTTLCTFKCLVSDTASGVLKVSEDEFDICDDSGDTISFAYSDTSAVTITPAPIAITAVTLNKSTLTLTEGANETLTATVTPDNATDKAVTWASSAPTVAKVDSSGKVTAVAEGTATITVTTKDGGKTATCEVTVKKAVCTHANKTEHPAVASTCIALGNNKYYTCDACGQAFKVDGTTETTVEAEKLTVYGEHVEGTPATCTEKATCSVCNKEYGELAAHVFNEKIEDAAHLASEGDCQTNKTYYYDCATCDLKGTEIFVSTSKGEHKISTSWTTENNKHYHECTVTGCYYVADESDCSGGTATCTKKAVCSVCNKEYGELAAHEYKTEWNKGDANGHWHDCKNCDAHDTQTAHTPGAEATETTPQVCTECGYIIKPATGHIKHTADTSKWLYDANGHWHKCVGCDEKMDEAAHTGGTATCTAQAECSVCGQAYGNLVDHVDTNGDDKCDECGSDMHVHSYSSKWSKDSEYHWHECECGAVDSKSAHKASGWIIDTYPTTVREGSRYKECTVCGYIMADEDIPSVQESGFERDRWAVIMSQLRNRKTVAPVEPDKSEKDEPVIESPEIIDEKLDAIPEEIVNEWINPFIDIFETDSYYKAIEFVYENGLFKGISATEFAPDTTMTRAMFVTVLGRLAGIDLAEYDSVDFDDVVPGEWYAPYVAWAASNGIVKGYGNGLFGINDKITVEQATTILMRYVEYADIEIGDIEHLEGYEDTVQVSDWAIEGMEWAVNSDIYEIKDNKLNPKDEAKRSLVATLICNFAEKYIY